MADDFTVCRISGRDHGSDNNPEEKKIVQTEPEAHITGDFQVI